MASSWHQGASLLLKYGDFVELNALDEDGLPPAAYACMPRNEETLELILNADCDEDILFDVAVAYGREAHTSSA